MPIPFSLKLKSPLKLILPLICACLVIFGFSDYSQGAEVLQVRSASLLQVGDNNRSYKVRLSCVVVNSSDELAAKEWLTDQLPRRKKVNLKPKGSNDGVLVASVIPIGDDRDLSIGLIEAGLAHSSCI